MPQQKTANSTQTQLLTTPQLMSCPGLPGLNRYVKFMARREDKK